MVLHVYYGSEDTDGYASLPLLLSGSDSETEHEAGTGDDTEREAGTDDGSTDDETDNESDDGLLSAKYARARVRPRARVCRIKQRRSSATAHLHPRLGHSIDVQFRREENQRGPVHLHALLWVGAPCMQTVNPSPSNGSITNGSIIN